MLWPAKLFVLLYHTWIMAVSSEKASRLERTDLFSYGHVLSDLHHCGEYDSLGKDIF